MKQLKQFILCNGKVPVAPTGYRIDPHNPANWMSYEDAKAGAGLMSWGVGFVFTSSDPYWFVDIDHCAENGEWNQVAKNMLAAFPGACVEVSQSGEGLHIFGSGQVPEHSCKNKQWGVELYHESRFALLNSDLDNGDPNTDHSANLRWLVDNYFPPGATTPDEVWRTEPVAAWNGPTDDAVLLDKMLKSGGAKAAFGGKATFRDLWENNETVLAQNYPSLNDRDPYDRSSADAALINHLAFWTGKNHERIRQFMLQSALVRDKWTKHKNYLTMSITNGVNGCGDVYAAPVTQEVAIPEPAEPDQPHPEARVGSQYLSPQQQLEYFKDCVYIRDTHRMLIPNGMFLKPDQFRATYGGYTFAMDAENIKTSKNAWEAFTESQAVKFPNADGVCFRPKLRPYQIIEVDGRKLVNTYVPISIKRTKGDASLFIEHARKVFKNETDYQIIMAYMAAMVQYPGTKFQWSPIIQGAEGNGKTLFFRCIEKALGSRYCHYPNASDLAGGGLKFNGWLEGKLAIFLEEIYVSDRREVSEPLKVLITNDRMEIQHKGQNQYTGDNVANIMTSTNHRDAMKLNYDQRRYCMIFTHQNYHEIIADGMNNLYFKRIWDWLRDGGYEIVTDYLMDYQIPDALNPAKLCHRAPESSSFHEAIRAGYGPVEQNLVEAINDERPGFRGGYISMQKFVEMLIEMRLDNKITPNKRSEILNSLGYVKHPWLRDGRVTSIVAAEQCKPRLYTNEKLGEMPTLSAAQIREHYEVMQGYTPTKLGVVNSA
jgi:hypothetical protein